MTCLFEIQYFTFGLTILYDTLFEIKYLTFGLAILYVLFEIQYFTFGLTILYDMSVLDTIFDLWFGNSL